jgi:hypothetical protein
MKSSFLILLALTSLATARLEETRAQCHTRYGEPVESSDTSLVFEKDSIRIQVDFAAPDPQAKAIAIRFAKLPAVMTGRYWPMKPEVIQAHLTDAQPGNWTRLPGGVVLESWMSPDEKLVAVFDHKVKILSIAPIANEQKAEKQ